MIEHLLRIIAEQPGQIATSDLWPRAPAQGGVAVKVLGWPSRHIVAASLLLATLLAWPGAAFAAQLTLTWVNSSTNELGFSIERSTGTTGTPAEIATTAAGVTTYTDLTVAIGSTYCYRLRAFNATAYSAYSNLACATVAQTFGLAVVKAGAGSGTVTSAPAGIVCGASCSASYPSGTAVTLTASPASGSTFTGWSGGGCSGTGTCTATVTATTTVIATFASPAVPPLTAILSLNKTTFSNGDALTLSANVQVNSAFANPVDAYVDVQDPFGFIRPVASFMNVNIPSAGVSGVAAAGTVTGVPAGGYTLSLVLVKAGGDPKNLGDRLSNFASISLIVQ